MRLLLVVVAPDEATVKGTDHHDIALDRLVDEVDRVRFSAYYDLVLSSRAQVDVSCEIVIDSSIEHREQVRRAATQT